MTPPELTAPRPAERRTDVTEADLDTLVGMGVTSAPRQPPPSDEPTSS